MINYIVASFNAIIVHALRITFIAEAKEICMTNRVIDYTNLENNIIIILSNGLTCSKNLYLISHIIPQGLHFFRFLCSNYFKSSYLKGTLALAPQLLLESTNFFKYMKFLQEFTFLFVLFALVLLENKNKSFENRDIFTKFISLSDLENIQYSRQN